MKACCINLVTVVLSFLGVTQYCIAKSSSPPNSALPAVRIVSLRADKLIYKPGEAGVLHVRVANSTKAPAGGKLAATLQYELTDIEVLPGKNVEIPAQGEQTIDLPFIAVGRWGVAARVTLSSGESKDSAEDYFSVTNNFFEVGIGYGTAASQTADPKYTKNLEKARAAYANWMEALFWAPCDWSLLVAPQKKWWSGQASYPEDEDNLKDLIARCHALGIKVAMYASRNPAGPFGWEMARRHSDWFGDLPSLYDAETLDKWSDPEWREWRKTQKGKLPWYRLTVDLRRLDALDWGIDQIIASVSHYGWDAVRFDGHYTIAGNDELSTRNMHRLKERVLAAHPDFRFGFNYGRAPEWENGITHEIREAMAGGGFYMQEGIRNWLYTSDRYQSWNHYATNELRIAKQIQSLGGSYHCIWSLNGMPAPQAQYKLIYGLIAGGHPAYDLSTPMPGGCAKWGAFMTRWSSMLWDTALTVVPNAKAHFSVNSSALQWEPLVQQRVQSEHRKFVILHLVNASPSDEIAKTTIPNPVENAGVCYRPESGTKLIRATLVRPEEASFQTELAPQQTDKGICVTVQRITTWAMVIWEIEGSFQVSTVPPKFTEPPDPAKMAQAGSSVISGPDPNQIEAVEKTAPGVTMLLLTSGGVNIGKRCITTDAESPQRLVQTRQRDQLTGKVGKWWTGPYTPGRYRLGIRLKWVDPEKTPTPQQLSMNVLPEKTESPPLLAAPVTYVTPGYPNPPQGAVTLGERGKYEFYDLGTVSIQKPEFFTFDGAATTTKIGEQTLFVEKIRIEQIERFSDAQVEAALPCPPKPAGLAFPNGASPKKALFVKGMFWQPYLKLAGTSLEFSYHVPSTYEELYKFDAVILCNIDPMRMGLPGRKMIKDFVQDGGRLVVLGGPHALGHGAINGTYVDEVLPVNFTAPFESIIAASPLILGTEPNKPFDERPAVFGILPLTAREKSTTLAWAGDRPVMVSGRFGKGVVFVFAGTALGESDGHNKAFWETSMWPRLFDQMVSGNFR